MDKERKQRLLIYARAICPLAVSQLLQRLEHVVDNRFIGHLGAEPLLIHSIQYNSFLAGQAIAMAAGTSALVFWKRAECLEKQRSLLRIHVLAAAVVAVVAGAAIYPFVSHIAAHFRVATPWLPAARLYLGLGLILMAAQAVYGPINAMLVATGQEAKSMTNVGFILACKFCVNLGAATLIADPVSALRAIMLGAIAVVILFSILAMRQVQAKTSGDAAVTLREVSPVFSSEFGTAAVRSLSPVLFGFLIAALKDSAAFYVSYQLCSQFAYILCLPLMAGMRLSLRDASEEESRTPDFLSLPLRRTSWFRDFAWLALTPTLVLLGAGVLAPGPLFRIAYGYALPDEHVLFVALYYLACSLGQIGNTLTILLRASKQNGIVMFNFLVSEIGVKIGLMGALIYWGTATFGAVGWVMLVYCGAHLALNYAAVRRLAVGTAAHPRTEACA